jgi:hypothetical protein
MVLRVIDVGPRNTSQVTHIGFSQKNPALFKGMPFFPEQPFAKKAGKK